MAEAEENREKRCHSMQMNGFSRDLLHKLEQISNENEEEEEEEEIELSLGLSLNGRFGVDPQRAEGLKRSSSVANFVFGTNENCNNNNNKGCSFSYVPPIVRTCSLPVEAEEECRKRKELQSLRRLEAKRKRMEKLQNVSNKVVIKEENGNDGVGNNSLQLSQGSMGSQGSGSSGISPFKNQPIQGPGDTTGTNTPTTVKSEHEQKQVATQPEYTSEKSPSICATASKEAKEICDNFMLNMPCVSTKGDGPNSKKIEGFLYRYQKGEEVKIVCVCHGSFLSPAEFIKHGGGGDVENPLRHIVVSPAPLLG